MSWFNTIEFYVIAGTIAAAAVAVAALPSRRGSSVLHMAAGELSQTGPAEPSLEVWVDDNRRVHIRRRGLPNVTTLGAASLAINVIGFDVVIEERLTFPNPRRVYKLESEPDGPKPVDTADFVLDFFAPERYHIRYNSEDAGVMCAFSLPVREGIRVDKKLQ